VVHCNLGHAQARDPLQTGWLAGNFQDMRIC
jgi:hypothetical protein